MIWQLWRRDHFKAWRVKRDAGDGRSQERKTTSLKGELREWERRERKRERKETQREKRETEREKRDRERKEREREKRDRKKKETEREKRDRKKKEKRGHPISRPRITEIPIKAAVNDHRRRRRHRCSDCPHSLAAGAAKIHNRRHHCRRRRRRRYRRPWRRRRWTGFSFRMNELAGLNQTVLWETRVAKRFQIIESNWS